MSSVRRLSTTHLASAPSSSLTYEILPDDPFLRWPLAGFLSSQGDPAPDTAGLPFTALETAVLAFVAPDTLRPGAPPDGALCAEMLALGASTAPVSVGLPGSEPARASCPSADSPAILACGPAPITP